MRPLADLIDIVSRIDFPVADEELLGELIAAVLGRRFVECRSEPDPIRRQRTLFVRLEPVDSGKWAEGYMRLPDERWPDRSLDAAANLIPANWWWCVGTCFLGDDAAIGPDYNGPAGESLRKHFPVLTFDGVFDEDPRPSIGIPGMCRGLFLCLLKARLNMQEVQHEA